MGLEIYTGLFCIYTWNVLYSLTPPVAGTNNRTGDWGLHTVSGPNKKHYVCHAHPVFWNTAMLSSFDIWWNFLFFLHKDGDDF